MNDMKLIMERFETFSEQQSTKSLVDYRPISNTAFRIIRNRVRYSARQFERYLRKKNSKYIARLNFDKSRKYLMGGAFSIDLNRAFKAGASSNTSNRNSIDAKVTIASIESRIKQRAQKERYLIQAYAFYKKPIISSINAAIRQYYDKNPEAPTPTEPGQPNIGTPNPNPGKKIDKDTQKKIDITGKIIQKYGFLGTKDVGKGAMKLNTMLQKYGAAIVPTIAPSTISAVYKFQKAYNKKYRRKITVDGLFGGQTNRAYKRMHPDAPLGKKPDAKKPDAEKAKADEKK